MNRPGTNCVLTLPGSKIESGDKISIVYNCYDTKPAGSPAWGLKNTDEEEVETRKISEKIGSQIKLSCNDNSEMIFANQVLFNGSLVRSEHRSGLTPIMVTKQCLTQLKEEKDLGKGKVFVILYKIKVV